MSALALNEPLRMPLGVAVSNDGEPLELVYNTGLREVAGEDEIHGPMVAQTIRTERLDPSGGSRIPLSRAGILDPGIQELGYICCICATKIDEWRQESVT